MNSDNYKSALLDLQTTLSARVTRDVADGRNQTLDLPGDSADASVVDVAASEDFTEAELDSTILKHIGDALRRIEDGTYGHCPVDGKPIERQRLDAVPWATYCTKHQKLLEAASRPKPTL